MTEAKASHTHRLLPFTGMVLTCCSDGTEHKGNVLESYSQSRGRGQRAGPQQGAENNSVIDVVLHKQRCSDSLSEAHLVCVKEPLIFLPAEFRNPLCPFLLSKNAFLRIYHLQIAHCATLADRYD